MLYLKEETCVTRKVQEPKIDDMFQARGVDSLVIQTILEGILGPAQSRRMMGSQLALTWLVPRQSSRPIW